MRVRGRTSTCPMWPTAISAREDSSVSIHCPTRTVPGPAPASQVTFHPSLFVFTTTSAMTAAAASATQYHRRDRRHPLLAAKPGALLVHHDVHGQAVQPRGERALAAKRAQLVPGAHEDVLCALLRRARVTGEAQA